MTDSAQKVINELTSAGLLSSDRVTDYGLPIESGIEVLLEKLVKDGHITEYQGDKLREGKSSEIYFGDYVVIDKLGQGGMGTVLLAKHRRMDRQVAIKILPVTVLESKEAVARFYQEVKVAAQLTHPNIVHAYDAGEDQGFHYLVMEYVPGHDLAAVLSELGPVPLSMAIDYIGQAANGLEYAHRKGVVHRDIKPSNLLLSEEGIIKVLDMGLARLSDSTFNQEVTQLTTTGQVMGTVEYMSPEQAEDTRQADHRSDIYSLGCTFYRLVTGKSPYSKNTVVKTILSHRSDTIPTIKTGFPEDEQANQLFQKMVAKKPIDRFQSTSALLEAIRNIENSDPREFDQIEQPGVGSLEPGSHEPSSHELSSHELSPSTDGSQLVRSTKQDLGLDVGVDTGSDERTVAPKSSEVDLIPEGCVEVVEDANDEVQSQTTGPANKVYIPETKSPTALEDDLLREKNQLLWGSFSLLASVIPMMGLWLGWFTWRSSKRRLKQERMQGRRASKIWLLAITKYLSIAATLIGFITTIAFVGCVLVNN